MGAEVDVGHRPAGGLAPDLVEVVHAFGQLLLPAHGDALDAEGGQLALDAFVALLVEDGQLGTRVLEAVLQLLAGPPAVQ